ncbi:MAG: hypothetical protein AAGE80_01295 [Pseudomonadota bacterium]
MVRKSDREWVRVMVMDWVAMTVATVLLGAMTYALVSDAALSVADSGVGGKGIEMMARDVTLSSYQTDKRSDDPTDDQFVLIAEE